MTASVGITAVRGGRDAAQLLVEADTAMYQAKDAGKGRIAVHGRRRGAPRRDARPG